MHNTIILQKGEAILTESEYKRFTKGDTICGDNSNPKELKRWNIDQAYEAKSELEKYKSKYTKDGQSHYITEYALEYCKCDEDGEFIEGSDYDFAAEGMAIRKIGYEKMSAECRTELQQIIDAGKAVLKGEMSGEEFNRINNQALDNVDKIISKYPSVPWHGNLSKRKSI